MDKIKTCRKCGADFKASPQDFTVNCPDCREAARKRVPDRSEFYAGKIAEAKSAGYAARKAGDDDAFDRAVATMNHWIAIRDSAGPR